MAAHAEHCVPPPPPAAPRAPLAVDGERDCLDAQLDLLGGSVVGAEQLDATAIELASLLAEKGDTASALRAHRVLAECGVQLGCWSMGEAPKLRPDAFDKPMGGAFKDSEFAAAARSRKAPPAAAPRIPEVADSKVDAPAPKADSPAGSRPAPRGLADFMGGGRPAGLPEGLAAFMKSATTSE